MNQAISKPYYWLIKNLNPDIQENKLKFFEKFDLCQIKYVQEKNICYILYNNNNIIDEIINYNYKLIQNEFNPNIKWNKVNKMPLDLNPPSNVLLLIFFKKSTDLNIDIEFLLKILEEIKEIKIEKIVKFKKKNSIQFLIKFNDIISSTKFKDLLPSKVNDLEFSLKIYFTEKKDIIIDPTNKNEIDFTKNPDEDENKTNNFNFKKNTRYSIINSLDTNNEKIKINNNFIGELSESCLYLISKNKINLNDVYNWFSHYSIIKTIKYSNNYKKFVIIFNDKNIFIEIYNKFKMIPKNYLKFNIILPQILNNEIHDRFLEGKNDLKNYYYKILNQKKQLNKTRVNSKFQKEEILNKTILFKNFEIKEQRKFIRSNKNYYFKISNVIIIKNLKKNTNLFKLEKYFRSKIHLSKNTSFISLTIPLKKYYILICNNIEISIKILMKFHNAIYEKNQLKIIFPNDKILNSLKNIYGFQNIKENIEDNKIDFKLINRKKGFENNSNKDGLSSEKVVYQKKNFQNSRSFNFNEFNN